MDAKELFESKKCQPSIFGKYDMIEFAESYHQAKSKEEAEERYNKGMASFEEALDVNDIWKQIKRGIHIASGKEES